MNMVDGSDWVIVLGWAMNVALGFAGVFERTIIYARTRKDEQNPRLPPTLRTEARLRREASVRRVWLKMMLTLISVFELAVTWDRWWYLDYDLRDVAVCLVMTIFLVWMLTWREP